MPMPMRMPIQALSLRSLRSLRSTMPRGIAHRCAVAALLSLALSAASAAADQPATLLAAAPPTPPSAPFTLPTRSDLVGINLSGIAYFGAQFPFADLTKSSGGWSSRYSDGAFRGEFPATRDGLPTALHPGQHAVAVMGWPGTHYPAGRYVVLWDGDGEIGFPMSRVRVVERQAHRLVVDVDNSEGFWVGIERTDPADPVRNVRVLWPGTEATYTTQPFNPEYLKKIAPFKVLRFMEWARTNNNQPPQVKWAERAHLVDATYTASAGVPFELMIDLANTLRADPWLCVPHQADDDFVRRMAQLVHDRLAPDLTLHIEYSNEVWNGGFAQSKWALEQSKKLGLPAPGGQPGAFYAQRSVQIFEIFEDVFGPADRHRLVRVLAGQSAWTNFAETALAWKDTAAHTDVLAIAPYFEAAAAADKNNVAATLAAPADALAGQMLTNIRGDITAQIRSNAALARKYKLRLEAYESGSGNTTFYFPQEQQDAMTNALAAANRSPVMRDVYKAFYSTWAANGGGLMLQYSAIGAWSKWGFWSALEYVTQDPATAPKYLGLLDVIASHPEPEARPGREPATGSRR